MRNHRCSNVNSFPSPSHISPSPLSSSSPFISVVSSAQNFTSTPTQSRLPPPPPPSSGSNSSTLVLFSSPSPQHSQPKTLKRRRLVAATPAVLSLSPTPYTTLLRPTPPSSSRSLSLFPSPPTSSSLPISFPFPFPSPSPPTALTPQPPSAQQPAQSAQPSAQQPSQHLPLLPCNFLSLDQAVCSKRTWLDIPREVKSSFTTFCKRILLAYKLASVRNDFPQMTRIISHFIFIPQLLLVQNRGGRKGLSHLRRQIDSAAAKFSEQEAFSSAILNSLQQRSLAAGPSNPNHLQDPQERDMLRRIANARRYMKLGCIGRAAKALMKSSLPPIDDCTIEQLQLLHPSPAHPEQPFSPPPYSIPNVVDKKKLGMIIRTRLANGSAPGPSGWTGEILSVLSQSDDCLDGLSHIIQDMTNNRLEPHARDLLTQSRLFAIPKSASDSTPRPLAIAEPLLKLANLYQLDGLQDSLFAHFSPLQEAICSPSGCEKAIHVLNAALEARTLAGPDLPAVLLADASNAFQSVPRTEVLSRLFANHELSALHGIASFTYGSPSSLVIKRSDGSLARIQSSEGVKQGCNLGTILYSIAMHPTFCRSIEGLDVTAKAYADDFSAVASPEVLLEVVNRLSNSNYGLNLSKTKLLWPHTVDPPAELLAPFTCLGIQIIRTGARLLGGFISVPGDEQNRAATDHLRSVVESHDPMFSALAHPSMRKQDSLLLLRYCTVPSLSFHARITSPTIASAPFQEFDRKILQIVFEKLLFLEGETLQTLHSNITHFHTASYDSVCSQISLPLRLGGLGIRSLFLSHSQAYWASMAASAGEVDACFTSPQHLADSAVQSHRVAAHQGLLALGLPHKSTLSMAEGPPEVLLPTSPTALPEFYKDALDSKSVRLQKTLSSAAEDFKLACLVRSFPLADVRRLESLKSLGASAWLTAIPDPDWPALSMPDHVFRRALRLRLHLPVDSAPFEKCFFCGASVTCNGSDPLHFLSCTANRRRAITNRHDLIVGAVTAAANRAGAPSGNEPSLHRHDPNAQRIRPDNYSHFPDGTFTLCDVSVTHAGAPSHRKNPLLTTLSTRASCKVKKYTSYASSNRASFIPLIIDVFGAFHADFYGHLKRISDAAVDSFVCLRHEKSSYLAHLVQVISIKLQTGNSWVVDEFVRKH